MKRVILLIIVFFSISVVGFTQDLKKTEKKAKKLFNKAYYEESLPLLHVLMKTKDNETYINYMFGVSSIETGNETPNKTLQSLLLASSRNLDELDIDYYIGRAYQDLFQPKKAISFFNKMLLIENLDFKLKGLVETHLFECDQASFLPSDIIKRVIWEKEASYQVFYKLYDFDSKKYGTILLTPDELSNGNSEIDLAYIPVSMDFIYYSRYDKSTRSKDLFRSTLNANGDYGEPERLNNYINGIGDEEFPVLSSDKSSLFFTSTGHKSTGKQDIYRTIHSMSGDWSIPTKLGLKVNSSFSDFLFFFIPEEGIAYFTSNRYHANGKVSVYKVELKSNVSNSLATTFLTPKSYTKTPDIDTVKPKAAVQIQEDGIANAKARIKQKQYANLLVDSSFIYAAQIQAKLGKITEQRNRCTNIAYNKNIQLKAFNKQYIDLAYQASNETYQTKLVSLKTYLNERQKDASNAKYSKKQASIIANEIKVNEQAYKFLADTLNSWSGKLQLLAASNQLDAVFKEYDRFVELMKEGDTCQDFTSRISGIEDDNSQIEDMLSMDSFIDNKIQIIEKSSDSPMVGEASFMQLQSDSKELITMAIVSYSKLVNSSTNYQKKYLKKDVYSFSEKAQIEQEKLIVLLDENAIDENAIDEGEYVVNDPAENQEIIETDEVVSNTPEEEFIEEVKPESVVVEEVKPESVVIAKIDNTGIKYRVQLGAFGENTDMNKFSTVPELSKEFIPNKNIFRLLSGNYSTYEQASTAKESLVNEFAGAFVVAYEGGKKIPVDVAIRNQSTPPVKPELKVEKIDEEQETNAILEKDYIPQADKVIEGNYTADVKENKGELYYLQLGTFSQPKVSNQLYGIDPLLYELLPNGLFRYFTGPYPSFAAAETAVVEIRSKGAANAFIVGYNDGEKVKIGNNVKVEAPAKKITPLPKQGLSYKVQLGAFSKKKTAIWIKDMEQRTGSSVEIFSLGTGVSIYTTGNFSTLEEASSFKQGLIDKGFNGVFVAAFKDGKKVPLR